MDTTRAERGAAARLQMATANGARLADQQAAATSGARRRTAGGIVQAVAHAKGAATGGSWTALAPRTVRAQTPVARVHHIVLLIRSSSPVEGWSTATASQTTTETKSRGDVREVHSLTVRTARVTTAIVMQTATVPAMIRRVGARVASAARTALTKAWLVAHAATQIASTDAKAGVFPTVVRLTTVGLTITITPLLCLLSTDAQGPEGLYAVADVTT